MRSQDPVDKSAYRRAEDDLKKLLYETKRKYFDEMLLNADPTKPYGFNLWKCTRNMKRQPLRKIPIKKCDDTWCRFDSEISLAFADELEKRFQPLELASREDVEETLPILDAPSPDALPIQHVGPEEVCLHIQKLHPRKAPGFDGVDSTIAKALPKRGILFLVLLFNSMLRIHHFPSQWKCAVIMTIPKPGKSENLVQSYRPISLLPTFSKIFEYFLAESWE